MPSETQDGQYQGSRGEKQLPCRTLSIWSCFSTHKNSGTFSLTGPRPTWSIVQIVNVYLRKVLRNYARSKTRRIAIHSSPKLQTRNSKILCKTKAKTLSATYPILGFNLQYTGTVGWAAARTGKAD